MKILRPVDCAKRLPVIPDGASHVGPLLVTCRINGGNAFHAFVVFSRLGWAGSNGTGDFIREIVQWYEQIELESLLPDEDTGYKTAEAASNNQIIKTMFHQEGQSYIRNYLIKMLGK